MDLDRQVPHDEFERIKKLLRRRPQSSGAVGTRESSFENLRFPLDMKASLEQLEQRLRQRSKASPAVRELAQQVILGAKEAIPKLDDGAASLSMREIAGLEAVILTDGTRPSLTIREGFVDLNASEIGNWRAALHHFQASIRSVIASVGRVDYGGNAIGTAFALGPDIVMTNRHVLEEIATPKGTEWSLNEPQATSIEFIGEEGTASRRPARVLGVAFAPSLPIERQVRLDRLDLALLRVEAGQSMPLPLLLNSHPDSLFDGRNVYVVGFPARPRSFFGDGPPPSQHETNQVLKELFDFEFGVKKLAPGQIDKVPGELAGDVRNWAFSHDASTLAGNSGSCIVDLTEDATRVVGLHFAGLSRRLNYAHSLAALREQLEPLGVRYAL